MWPGRKSAELMREILKGGWGGGGCVGLKGGEGGGEKGGGEGRGAREEEDGLN